MSAKKNVTTLEDTFAMMAGEAHCDIHNAAGVGKSTGFGDVQYHCPLCLAEYEAADLERIREMNESEAFADFHAKTDA